jgi:DNA-binding beta-propeller fold protein YncE
MRHLFLAWGAPILLLAQTTIPPLPYQVVPAWPRLPLHENFMETAGVAVDGQNNVYVLHRGRNPIMQFNADGQLIRAFGDGLFDRSHSIRIDSEGNIWTVDDGSHTVLKLNRHGRIQMVLGRWRSPSDAKSAMPDGSAGGPLRGLRDEGVVRFSRPTDVAFGPNGDIFVADGYGNSRVVKFSKDGRFLKEWGKRGSAPGEFHTPHSIVADKQGRVYVADRENYRIQVFDAEGKFLKEFRQGAPWGLAITADDHLFMADGYNNRIVKMTLDGKVVGAFGSHGKQPGQFHYCHQLAVTPEGAAVYTAEILNWRAQKFVLQ